MSEPDIRLLTNLLSVLNSCAELAKPACVGPHDASLQHALSEAQLLVVKAIIKEIS